MGNVIPSNAEPSGMHLLLEQCSDEESVERYFVNQRWPNGIRCPKCDCNKVYDCRMRRNNRRRKTMWKCGKCAHKFSVTSGTVMESSKLPLRKWMAAYCVLGRNENVSARKLARMIGIGLRPAWHLGRRIRKRGLGGTLEFEQDSHGQ